VRSGEAPQPERLGLARDLPDEGRLAALTAAAVRAPLVPGGRIVVHEQADAGERIAGRLRAGGGRGAEDQNGDDHQHERVPELVHGSSEGRGRACRAS
jgi:hypothetical protein